MDKIDNKPKMSRNKKILLVIIITIFSIFILIKVCSFVEDKILLDDLKNQINDSDLGITICNLDITTKFERINIGVIVSYDYEKGLSSNERAASASKIRDVVQNYLDTHSIRAYLKTKNCTKSESII